MIEFSGFDELAGKLADAAKKVPRAANKFVVQEAEVVIGNTKNNSPVRTGSLRRGWKRTRAKQGTVTIYNNTPYAAHVEYGHRVKVHGKFTGKVVPGQHMLRDGMQEAAQTFEEDAQAIFEELLS